MELDLNSEEMKTPITLRERLAVHILLWIFCIIIKPEYKHQIRELVKDFQEAIKDSQA